MIYKNKDIKKEVQKALELLHNTKKLIAANDFIQEFEYMYYSCSTIEIPQKNVDLLINIGIYDYKINFDVDMIQKQNDYLLEININSITYNNKTIYLK